MKESIEQVLKVRMTNIQQDLKMIEVKKERLKFELKELEQELTSSKERRDFWRNKTNKEPLTA